eukprot:UN12475
MNSSDLNSDNSSYSDFRMENIFTKVLHYLER